MTQPTANELNSIVVPPLVGSFALLKFEERTQILYQFTNSWDVSAQVLLLHTHTRIEFFSSHMS